MKYKLSDPDIKAIDKAIKIHVAARGDYTEPDTLLSRLIWNICFNPVERPRCLKIINQINTNSELKDLPQVQGKLPGV